jgi:hypothetical protein
MMDFLKHWNYHSFSKSSTFQAMGYTFEQWFGYNQHAKAPPAGQCYRDYPKVNRVFRPLLLNGFTGHTSSDIQNYCIAFDIKLGFQPPHSIHLFQPLDISVFGPMKKKHQGVLHQVLREGKLSFSRSDFLAGLQVRKRSFYHFRIYPEVLGGRGLFLTVYRRL